MHLKIAQLIPLIPILQCTRSIPLSPPLRAVGTHLHSSLAVLESPRIPPVIKIVSNYVCAKNSNIHTSSES